MATEESSEGKEIGRYTGNVRAVQERLLKLAFSSFLFSALGVIGQVPKFHDDPGFLVLSQLLGALAGVAAVLLTFFRSAVHPKDEEDRALEYEPGRLGIRLASVLLVAALLLYIHYEAVQAGSRLSVFPFAAANFAFFYAITNAAVNAAALDRRRAMWEAMDDTARQNWTERWNQVQQEKARRNAKARALTEKIQADLNMRAEEEEVEKRMDRRERWEQRRQDAARKFLALRRATGLRWLLTKDEQEGAELEDAAKGLEERAEKRRFNADWRKQVGPTYEEAAEAVAHIDAGNSLDVKREERNKLNVYQVSTKVGIERYILIDDPHIDARRVTQILELASEPTAADSATEAAQALNLVLVVPASAMLTAEADNLLKARGVWLHRRRVH